MIMMTKPLVFFTLLALGMTACLAQDKPTLEQAREKFEAADALLGKTCKETCDGLDKTGAAALQKKQQAWLKFRDAKAESLLPADAEGKKSDPKLSVDYWETMTGYTEVRIDFLHAWSGKNLPPGITGEYTDSEDGDLQLEETKDGIEFSFSVVRGNASHAGQITGIIQPKGGKAYFKEKLEDGQKGPPCELAFAFTDGHIVKVVEKSPDPDVESDVHYGGDYFKTTQAAKP